MRNSTSIDARNVGDQIAQPCQVVERTLSTNTDLLSAQWPAPGVCKTSASLLALEQTGGRGRQGRQWIADAQRSLCMSIAQDRLDPGSIMGARLPGLSLAIGTIVAETLETVFSSDIAPESLLLKWPNDLVRFEGSGLADKAPSKVAGILIEVKQHASYLRIVVGLGVNLVAADDPLQPEALVGSGLTPGFVFSKGTSVDRILLANRLATSMHNVLDHVLEFGWRSFHERFNRRHALPGLQVSFGEPQQNGRVLGVSNDAALLVQPEAGGAALSVHAGEIKMRYGNWVKASTT